MVHVGANVDARLHGLIVATARAGNVSTAEWLRRAIKHAIGIPASCAEEADARLSELRIADDARVTALAAENDTLRDALAGYPPRTDPLPGCVHDENLMQLKAIVLLGRAGCECPQDAPRAVTYDGDTRRFTCGTCGTVSELLP